ncbi:MIND kinetochore complex component Mtw1 [Rasamsonia emersonii CBS 393.64]|uniref:MIND kinetochore complex component Mtw1 n=1 Tax=Rasamsonia emersonii (strain ATCC 16479 / CBS 393.64 / IMI 116815) TaxID=1408163 RepID=A0A0F4YID2_RASE3|nr:MIND kinetochore complex component Mtw1 [Rasamsonia emersonii CBS 393.64]KKA17880.1 MIND kinetochore complex component Mtw1 [Rasamsonia emersonii CBS 393.64]
MNDATTALLTEHFSYTPLAISSLESGLLSTPPERLGFRHSNNGTTIPDTDGDGNVEYPEAKLEIENGLNQLETLFEANVDKAFDKFEIYVLRNILTVPQDLVNWVRLGHYENLSFSDQESDAPTPESINLQRKKLQETRKLQRALKQECERNDAIIAQLRAILSDAQSATSKQSAGDSQQSAGQDAPNLSFLTSDPAAKQLNVGSNAGPLTTNTTFILSQLPALRSMLNQLRPKLSTLPKSVDEMDLDSKKDERREYIESRVRLHLERAGEPALGDGNSVVAGRKIKRSEAQAIENVANILNK